jgi:hypothetical protein
MISNSDTVQTLTLGLAFTALFIGATASLPSSAENVLYTTKNTTKNTTNTTASADKEATGLSIQSMLLKCMNLHRAELECQMATLR